MATQSGGPNPNDFKASNEGQTDSSNVGAIYHGFADAYAGVRGLNPPGLKENSPTSVSQAHQSEEGTKDWTRIIVVGLGIFLLAALPRLLVVFSITDVDNPGIGWYNDTFHHWQIARLSQEVGFDHGFLRLWDFKGLEYFWGLLHPLILIFLFTVTGSIDILIPRLVSLVFGSASIVLLYFLLKRHFNIHVGLTGTILAILLPVSVFADSAGLLQPISIFLLLLGLLFWPKHAAWAGIAWALSGTVRAEYWVFGAGMVIAASLSHEKTERKIALWTGWLIPILLYMKYMLDQTGNAIYPLYWNFMGNAAGEWMGDRPLNEFQTNLRLIGRIVLLVAGLASVWILSKRRRSYLLALYGLGTIIFMALTFGVSEYIHGVLPRILYARLLIVPYMTVGISIAILFLYALPKLGMRKLWLFAGWALMLLLVGATQLAWDPILGYYEKGKAHWAATKSMAAEVASHYEGGTLSIPEDRPLLTYALVRYEGIPITNLEGQMYDPFAYFGDPDPFANWSENRDAIANWLDSEDIKLVVYHTGKGNYETLVDREPEWFEFISTSYAGLYQIYEVDDGFYE